LLVKKLEINGFRNLNNYSIHFSEEKNLIFGVNGSGKTSVIEALFLLGFGKSFLPVSKKDLINFNASGFFLNAKVLNNSGENDLTASMEKSFSLQLNGEKTPLAQISQYLYPLFFSHFNYSYYIDYIPYFRKVVDRFIYGLGSLYLHDVLRYNNILKQKNYLLKNLGKAIHNSELNSWNTLLAETGCKIVKKRMSFINRLNQATAEIFGLDLKINYYPALLNVQSLSETTMLLDLEQVKNSEIKSRRCLLGPQRDRFDVVVSGKKLPLFSSGEKKKYLLMVYVAFIELFRQARNDYPVFLIDDYDAAMDEENLGYLLDHFPAMQVIATSVARNEKFGHLFELKKEN
jgi:DNA replication and repair protein RecF